MEGSTSRGWGISAKNENVERHFEISRSENCSDKYKFQGNVLGLLVESKKNMGVSIMA